jgi:TrmH family RNA methyltransferase
VRASAGSLFHLPVCIGGDVAADLPRLRAAGLTVLAADGHADLDLDQATDQGLLAGPTAWVFGNEAWGLPEATRALADHVVKVPIHGRAESLNLAAAAAVCLYASARAQLSR